MKANHHPHPRINNNVTLVKTHLEGEYDTIDENGITHGSINPVSALSANKLTVHNQTVHVESCPLEYFVELWLNTDRYDWIVDYKTHPLASNPCEMINSPLFDKSIFGAWLSDSVAIVKQVPSQNQDNNKNLDSICGNGNDNNANDDQSDNIHDCDTATLLKPGDIRTYVGSNGNTCKIFIETIRHTLETAPQQKIIFKPLWSVAEIIRLFAKELKLPIDSDVETVCNQSMMSEKFQDPSGILHVMKNLHDRNLTLNNTYLLSTNYLDDKSYTNKNKQFTLTKLSLSL